MRLALSAPVAKEAVPHDRFWRLYHPFPGADFASRV